MPKKTDSSKLVVGERIALFNYYKVDNIDSEWVHCTDENGSKVRIGRPIVDSCMLSTTQFTKTVKVTQTRMTQILETLGQKPLCVCFHKKVETTYVADELEGKDVSTKAKRRKVVKELMTGEERIMHCRLYHSTEEDLEMELGRYRVIDLEKSVPGKMEQRWVDTRTIKWIIADGVKFTV